MAGLYGLLSTWAVLHLFGHTRPWPWRVADLQSTQIQPPASPPITRGAPERESIRSRKSQRQIQAEVPAVVDLLHLAVSAGHSLHTAVAAVAGITGVAGSGTGLVIGGLVKVQQRFERGGRLAEELAKLPTLLGPALQPLSTTLIVAASSGAPLGPSLQRLADAERRRLRRRTEERVRKLPVLLLLPLITLVLPAFVLLTVVPVAITTARTGLTPLNSPEQHSPEQHSFPPPNANQLGPP